MGKKFLAITILFFTVVFCAAFIGNENKVLKSDGGPPYNTNAPGEKTCSGAEGANSCHSGGISDNSGPGTPTINFSGGTTYVPGQTYTINPTITHPSRNRFGFQMVSLQDSNNAFIGTITLIDTNKTRMQQPTWGSYQDRIFVMHRLAGSYPTTPNIGSWTYKWTAPAYNAGNISFYACFISANNNNTNDAGDQTYYTKITISPSSVGINSLNENPTNFSIYPNPANEKFNIDLSNLNHKDVLISVMDVQGQEVKSLKTKNSDETIDVKELANGMYSVLITEGNKLLGSKKTIIQH